MYLIFYILLLELVLLELEKIILKLYIEIYKEDYKVKKILNKKYINKEIKYLVK